MVEVTSNNKISKPEKYIEQFNEKVAKERFDCYDYKDPTKQIRNFKESISWPWLYTSKSAEMYRKNA